MNKLYYGENLTVLKISQNGEAAEMLRSMRAFLKENDMMAYLSMIAVRLIHLHRVLKPKGSIYIHSDSTCPFSRPAQIRSPAFSFRLLRVEGWSRGC